MIYIAFLQGINQGHNRMKMNDLKKMLVTRGLKNVETYLQNGNVVFESDMDEMFLRKMIAQEIFIIYKYVIPVVIRTQQELQQVIKNCPFSKEEIQEAKLNTGERPYVVFLKDKPENDKKDILSEYSNEGNLYQLLDKEIYLLFLKDTIRKSRLVRNLYRIDVQAVIRNWSTVNKLNQLAKKLI